jgi:hypothetical protein
LPQPAQSVSLPVPPTSQSLPRSPKIASLPSLRTLAPLIVHVPFGRVAMQPAAVVRPSFASKFRKYW